MRQINRIIIHCSATVEGQHFTVTDIESWHKARGFRCVGYHYIILLDGTIQKGRGEGDIGAHCEGYNSDSIGVCYIGGLDTNKQPKDTRTEAQKQAITKLLADITARHSIKEIKGHRDYSPDRNKNGIVEPFEWLKACPCYEVQKEHKLKTTAL